MLFAMLLPRLRLGASLRCLQNLARLFIRCCHYTITSFRTIVTYAHFKTVSQVCHALHANVRSPSVFQGMHDSKVATAYASLHALTPPGIIAMLPADLCQVVLQNPGSARDLSKTALVP